MLPVGFCSIEIMSEQYLKVSPPKGGLPSTKYVEMHRHERALDDIVASSYDWRRSLLERESRRLEEMLKRPEMLDRAGDVAGTSYKMLFVNS